MKFSYVVLYCSNMEKSVHFYRDIIGLECERRYTEEDGVDTAANGRAGMWYAKYADCTVR